MTNRRNVLVGVLSGAAALALPGLTAGGLSLPMCSAAGPPRPRPRKRLEHFVEDAAQVAAFRNGVAVMKARRPSDPTSWFWQAAVHGVSEKDLARAKAGDSRITPALVQTFWRKCPHGDKDRSADFLLWHRAYLLYFERILRDATGDPRFSLPYWNYLDKTQRGFPALFSDPMPDREGRPANPLYDSRRYQPIAKLDSDYELNLDDASSLDPFKTKVFFSKEAPLGMAGGANPEKMGAGRLEGGLHDLVHEAVGGPAGLMSDTDTAALDPVFWVHHATIDRIWRVFDCMPGKGWGDAPEVAWFGERPWVFADVGGVTARRETRAFFLDSANLQATYDSDATSCRPLSATPLPSGGQTPVLAARFHRGSVMPAAVDMQDMASAEASPPDDVATPDAWAGATIDPARGQVGATAGRIALLAERPTLATIELSLPSGTPDLAAALRRPPGEPGSDAAGRRVYLDLLNLSLTKLPNVSYGVFVNLPGESVTDSDQDHFVGTVAVFGVFKGPDEPGGSALTTHHGMDRRSQRFDITRQVSGLADPSRVKVTIVPRPLVRPRSSAPWLPPDSDLSAEQIRIVVV